MWRYAPPGELVSLTLTMFVEEFFRMFVLGAARRNQLVIQSLLLKVQDQKFDCARPCSIPRANAQRMPSQNISLLPFFIVYANPSPHYRALAHCGELP